MKSKVATSVFLFILMGIIYFTTTSESYSCFHNGTGCGGTTCHAPNPLTIFTLELNAYITAFPTSYIPGQSYEFVFKVGCGNSGTGMNISANAGTFATSVGSAPFSQTSVSFPPTQISHSGVGGCYSHKSLYRFVWTAPSNCNSPVTITCVGLNSNGNGLADTNDYWNTMSVTLPCAAPASVNDVKITKITCYPNPATDFIIVDDLREKKSSIHLTDLFGRQIAANCSFESNQCKIDCSHLSSGFYIVSVNMNGSIAQSTFVKR